jgi:hypothetical protein
VCVLWPVRGVTQVLLLSTRGFYSTICTLYQHRACVQQHAELALPQVCKQCILQWGERPQGTTSLAS